MDTSNSVSPELFFNEAEFRVLTPNLSFEADVLPPSDEILTAPPRQFTFYDEQVRVFLYARVPHQISGVGDDVFTAVQTFFQHLDVHVEASITDGAVVAAVPSTFPPPLQPSSSFTTASPHHRSLSTKLNSSSSSAPSSPKTQKRDIRAPVPAGTPPPPPPADSLPFFSHTYNSRGKDTEPIIFEHEKAYCCLFPLVIPVLYVKTRAQQPQLLFNFNVSYRPLPSKSKDEPSKSSADASDQDVNEYDTELFETIDLLGGLSEDPVFASPLHQRFVVEKQSRQAASGSFSQASHSTPHMLTLRRHVHETLAVRSGLNVKMRTTNASIADKMVMMSVELENPVETDCVFMVDKVEVHVSNSVVSSAFAKEVDFPMTLETLDQMVFLYNVTLLEDGSAKPPQQPQRIFPVRHRPTPSMPMHYQDERLQPQRVSIQVFGAPVVDGVRAATMRSKWNTMLDVSSMRQKREEPDPRFSSLLTSSPQVDPRSSASLATSVSVSPGARSLGSPLVDPKKRMLATMDTPGSQTPVMNRALPPPPPSSTAATPVTRRTDVEIVDGIVVSFTVPPMIRVGKEFPLQVFIVNRSKHTRRFQVMVPNRKRQHPPTDAMTNKSILPVEQSTVDPYMDETEFLRLYFENETHEADIICLENNVRLSPLGPSTSQSVDIRFIAVKEKLHTIDLIQLVDQDTGFVTNLRHVLEIFVDGPELKDS
ncbi:hypothetical protein K492DRAFT_232888 [Lichtheimia hyalospora FSU 10163]|nr:hypothetical protein K492DRAFT_232888 [Lichtheimia hyalospora FSU 10163]